MSFNDVLNINGEFIPALDDHVLGLLEEGKKKPTQILDGVSAERFKGREPYAMTRVSIDFDNENDLLNCVRLLRWSDERLLQMGSTIMWNWERTVRNGMNIKFAVAWHDPEFFEQRKDAFRDKSHASYFSMFGKSMTDMTVETEILRKK